MPVQARRRPGGRPHDVADQRASPAPAIFTDKAPRWRGALLFVVGIPVVISLRSFAALSVSVRALSIQGVASELRRLRWIGAHGSPFSSISLRRLVRLCP